MWQKMSEINQLCNCVFSNLYPTISRKCPCEFFGHAQECTLSVINAWEKTWMELNLLHNCFLGYPDDFPGIHLTQCNKNLSHLLKLLWKASLTSWEIPLHLNKPLWHQFTREAAETYIRTTVLSPTSQLIKIPEKLFVKNIHQFLETHHKMNPKQNGVRSGRCCIPQLLVHHNKILEENWNIQTMSMLFI